MCDHLHDVKMVHYCPTRYTQARVLDRSVGCCADRRAEGVHGEYQAHARDLDARHHADVADPERRPILTRLSTYPRVRGLVIGAFAETSADVRLLLRETAEAAAARFWRDAGATSATAAQSVYMSVYRRRWGAEFALQGARRAHDFGRSPSARTDGTALVSRCLRVGGVPCECVVGRGRREMCVCVCVRPAPPFGALWCTLVRLSQTPPHH